MAGNEGPKRMDPEKRAALEADGWKLGTVQQLLELSDEDLEVIEHGDRKAADDEEHSK